MRHALYLAGAAAVGPMLALATPAHAGLQFFLEVTPGTPASIQCPSAGSPSPCDYNPAGNILTLSPEPFTFNGVLKDGELVTATGVPGAPGIDALTTSSLAVINETGVEKTVTVTLSDINFAGPVVKAELTASGTWQATLGSTITVKWWADPTNTQGADTSGNTPGILLDTFTTSATGPVQSFSDNSSKPFTASGPFSMTEQVTYNLAPFGELLSRGVGMVATDVPEPSTWAMMLLGFVGLGFAGYRSSRSKVSVVD